jgi:hypothetical protein
VFGGNLRRVRTTTQINGQITRLGNVITRFTVIPDEPIASVQTDNLEVDFILLRNGLRIPITVYMEDITLEVGACD